ncbi:NADPH-dependent 2,4-dienoyl-CoA reductase/sulfur reductase-like enzyme/ferredoxin [Arthrobacter sp. B3I9]|uniref:FAD-dependent oxidoreductase n=1 Tax=Arthrobacter sp. B3I9 TaxID=3042270 RepID=UPI00278F2C22|nr:FAD-dependent oxidoreductase [Arthrobacter sp. B3I9]MDQ0850547.1 NADPH-dependent 2,4-dienoyl-CoA reductase/sulfur reductase-like enzyme/ferredoxin [Arthrobacter sp. B3I9]
MRILVDLTKCQGYAQCAFLAPEVFTIQGDEALTYNPHPDSTQLTRIRRAAAACPVQAIRLDQLDGRDRSLHRDAAPSTAAPVEDSGGTFKKTGRIVIVGASMAGLRAAERLREEGFTGSLTLVGEEPHEPYDRPPLSKQVLAGSAPREDTSLPRHRDISATWRLGVAATGLDLAAKQLHLADGSRIGFDKVLIATGLRARPWPNAAEAALTGVLTLRTREDAATLRQHLARHPRRVLVIGAGFIGCEVASVCRELGLNVTVAEAGPAPLVAALGEVIGAAAGALQVEKGVDLRCGVRVLSLEGNATGQLRRAVLSDGTTLDVDVAVAALGAVRNVEWLADSGLACGVWGVACDAGCRAFDANGLVTDDVFVAGDIARAPQPMYGYQYLAVEHWGNAVSQAEVAAHNMVSPETERWPHLEVPKFWSVQFGTEIKSVGVPSVADEVAVVQGSVDTGRFLAVYGYKGRLVAAVAFNHNKWLDFYEPLIEQAAPFPPSFHHIDEPAHARPVPAGFKPAASPTQDATVVVTGHDPNERRARLTNGAADRTPSRSPTETSPLSKEPSP